MNYQKSKRASVLYILSILLVLLVSCVLFVGISYREEEKRDKTRNEMSGNMGSLVITYQEGNYCYDGIERVENPKDYLLSLKKLEVSDFTYSHISDAALQSVYYDSERNVIYSYPALFTSNGENAINVFRIRNH